MAEKKITKREVINTMLADENVKGHEMYVAYLQNELALLNKKAEKKVNAEKSAEVAEITSVITEVLGKLKRATVTDIQLADERLGLARFSNQKVTSVLREMKANGLVDKATEKGKTLYFLV